MFRNSRGKTRSNGTVTLPFAEKESFVVKECGEGTILLQTWGG